MLTRVKTDEEIAAMREGGRMLAVVLNLLKKEIRADMTTQDLADIARRELKTLGGDAAFLGQYGFKDVICISVNDEVVHGIPSKDKVLQTGDVVGLDFGVRYKGMVTDAAISVIVGGARDPAVAKLVRETERALHAGIDVLRDGVRTGDVAAAIQKVLDESGYGIVRDLVGHGVGHELHEEPNIPNYGHSGSGSVLKAGMTIAIEPMATLGGYEVNIDPDGWTIRTRDGSLSAHFEHTVLITQRGAEILTQV